MKKVLIPILALSLSFWACSNKTPKQSDYIDIQDSADSMRYEKPEGNLSAQEIPQYLKIELANRFPVWRDSVAAAVDISMRNTSKSHLPARIQAHLYVYSNDTKQPLYGSIIDVSHGRSSEQGIMSVISIPVGASHDVIVPIQATQWASIDANTPPDTPFHTLIPTGKYLMRFEVDIIDDKDHPITTVVSNFIEFETIASANVKEVAL